MLRAIDPTATFEWTPPGQDELPESGRVRLRCRYLTMRQQLELRELRADALKAANDVEYGERILSMFRIQVVSILGMGDAPVEDVSRLADVATFRQLWDWSAYIVHEQSVTEAELGKSERPWRSAAAGSAAPAGGESA